MYKAENEWEEEKEWAVMKYIQCTDMKVTKIYYCKFK